MPFRSLGYAPLLPFALAATAGIVVDRYAPFDSFAWLIAAGCSGLIWLAAFRRNELLAQSALWVACGALAGAYYHSWRYDVPADDISQFTSVEPRLVRVRGTLGEEPFVRRGGRYDPLVSRPRTDWTATVLDVSSIESAGNWIPASGRARLTINGALTDLHVGDEVEVLGWLAQPAGPMNPGERDYASHLRDEGIHAELRVRHSAGVVRYQVGTWGIQRSLASLRSWGERGINSSLPPDEANIAAALLLGNTTAMSADEWDRYVQTGVIHVLAISGQHLVMLGGFLWFTLRLIGMRRRQAALIVAVTLLAYAMMTGARPSAIRAAVIACSVCGGFLLRAKPPPANTFSLAWLIVLAIGPTDLFSPGFQLSFLCVAVLIWGIPKWFPPRPLSDREILIEEFRTPLERVIRGVLHGIGRLYLISLVLGIATAPLIAYWQNIVSPAGVLIGPPAIILTTVALIAGFLLLILWPLGPIAWPLAWVAGKCIWLCEALVDGIGMLPGSYWHVGMLPLWWVIGFYSIGIAWLFVGASDIASRWPFLSDRRLFPGLLAAWTIVGLAIGLARTDPDELRVAVLSVEHGCCAVIESPDGRVLLYDAGATAGPEVTKRQIAPFLWSRGIRRIDEVFLSHADLDHFNGLPALLDRFAVGQISTTPTFSEKPTAGVREALTSIERRGITMRVLKAGDRLTAGPVEIDVLHPPPVGPEGVENVRSLVLLVRHRGHSILLTGDIEEAGIDVLKSTPSPKVDVLLTPHHGSGPPAELIADWVQPRLVLSSQGRGDAGKAEAIFKKQGVPYWPTWPNGAIAIRSHSTGLVAETFATGQRMVVRSGSGE